MACLGGEKNCAAIRAKFPIPEQCGLFYFEVDIINKGENGGIEIRFCTKSASLNKKPDFMTDDTIGCCLNIRNSTLFYTKNEVNLGIAFRDLKNTLYSCVEILSPGGSVRANFGYKKFKYT
ncbi:1832_t:CDS:2, partial [Funneliformis geosporum]